MSTRHLLVIAACFAGLLATVLLVERYRVCRERGGDFCPGPALSVPER